MDGHATRLIVAGTALLTLAACSSSGSARRAAVTPTPSTATVTTTPAATVSAPPTSASGSASGSSATASAPPSRLSGVRIADVTFVGSQGWLLGTADCLDGSGGACTAIEHSTDSGRSWQSMSSPAGVNVAVPTDSGSPASCGAPCVAHIRYASATVGYLYGGGSTGALYVTTDAGRSWQRQSGGVDALEVANGIAIRVTDAGGCPPGCSYTVQRAPVGSSDWTTVTLPGSRGAGDDVTLGRAGSQVWLAVDGNPAGGAQHATSVVWSSSDNGTSWRNHGEPCRQVHGHEYDSSELTVAPTGAAVLLCTRRGDPSAGQSITVSTDSGFAQALASLGAAQVSTLGAASPTAVFASSDQLYRSTDGGDRFAAVGGTNPGQLAWIGFSTSTVGHAISLDRSTLWNTTDAGQSWTSVVPH